MTRKITIKVLAENTAQGPRLLGEHGLAFWIELDGRHVLFDTGQGNVLTANAYWLGVSLAEVDAIVISHGHYDHTGALADALRGDRPKTVFAHPSALEAKYARNRDGSSREIGIPFPCFQAVRRKAAQVIDTRSPATVIGGLTVTGPIPRVNDFEETGGPFFIDQACRKADPLDDDQAVFFETSEGTVVLVGCAHAGVINTLRYVDQLTDGRPIHAVIGGLHLVQASPERIGRTVEELRRLHVRRVAPAHCTGTAAVAALWQGLPGRCVDCHVGTQFEFQAL